MAAERITLETVRAERDRIDGEERRILGDVIVSLGFTNATVKTLAPREMEEVAAYLTALLERAPLKTSRAYEAHRMVLGSLATELRGFAAAAGEPTGLQADLRAASSQAEERRVAERIDAAAVAYDRHVDDILLEHAARRAQMDPYVTGTVITDMDLAERGIGAQQEEDATTADQPTETDDVARWL